jgi:hypothetical protein
VPTAVVQARNLRLWTGEVDGIVKLKLYVTLVSPGTADEIVSEREVICPAALAFLESIRGISEAIATTKQVKTIGRRNKCLLTEAPVFVIF